MSQENEQKNRVSEAVKLIVSRMKLKSGIKLDGLSLRPKHELDSFSMGCGMTSRTIERLRTDFPDEVIEHLVQNKGTTIFLGNGTSLVPLEISQKQQEKGLQINQKVLIDQVDLPSLLEDLTAIETQLHTQGFSETFDIEKQKERVQQLVGASQERNKNIKIRTGLIGESSFLDIHNSGDVVFNCYGPSIETLRDQLRLVKPGGVLYATYYPDDFRRQADDIGNEALQMIESIVPMKSIVRVTRKK